MRISLSPIRMDASLSVTKAGDVLTINGEANDFSTLPNGATIPAGEIPCDWIAGPVERDGDGTLHLALILPCAYDAPEERLFPSPIEPADGAILFPGDPA